MSKLKKGIITTFGVIGVTILMLFTLLETGIRAAEFNVPAPAVINLNTATLNMPGTITVASSGTLQASTGTITVSNNGNWSNSGTFSLGNGTVQQSRLGALRFTQQKMVMMGSLCLTHPT